MTYNPDYVPTGDNNKINPYRQRINHRRIAKVDETKQELFGTIGGVPQPIPPTNTPPDYFYIPAYSGSGDVYGFNNGSYGELGPDRTFVPEPANDVTHVTINAGTDEVTVVVSGVAGATDPIAVLFPVLGKHTLPWVGPMYSAIIAGAGSWVKAREGQLTAVSIQDAGP